MLILVVGSLVVARMRSWQPVNILSFLFTWGIYAASNPVPGHGTYSMPYVRTNGWLEHADLTQGQNGREGRRGCCPW